MWDLYTDFEAEFKNVEPYDPIAELLAHVDSLAATTSAASAVTPGNPSSPAPPPPAIIIDATFAIIEGARLHSQYDVKRKFRVAGYGPMGDPMVRQEQLRQGWSRQITS